ncbi:MAG: hypothetical protein AAFQ15_07380 [Pseudomonadota bacterium]
MSNSTPTPTKPNQPPLTLLATTALAVSNLIVGILQDNRFLVFASAILAAVFAVVYLLRIHRPEVFGVLRSAARGSDSQNGKRLPLWIFAAILFVILPALFMLMQYLRIDA